MSDPRKIWAETPFKLRYSFCTIVNRPEQYFAMVDDFKSFGFDEGCEYLFIDNSNSNYLDAYSGYNLFLRTAAAKYIILCHQDLSLISDGRDRLDAVLGELDRTDKNWGLCGNAGVNNSEKENRIRISDPGSDNLSQGGPFPAQVDSLDENFIVVKNEANLGMSRDLTGFHWYGHDICLIANAMGWSAYVVDFHLKHHSRGTTAADYMAAAHALRRKYAKAFHPRWQRSVSGGSVFLSGSPVRTFIARGSSSIMRNMRSIFSITRTPK